MKGCAFVVGEGLGTLDWRPRQPSRAPSGPHSVAVRTAVATTKRGHLRSPVRVRGPLLALILLGDHLPPFLRTLPLFHQNLQFDTKPHHFVLNCILVMNEVVPNLNKVVY